RKRPLPRLPRRIGLVTGNDAAAKRDVLTTITARFPAASVLVAETYGQGAKAAAAIVDALRRLCEESLVRAVASAPVPIVSAVGHEQDTPLCDLAADVRASTPTAAGRLVVPD